MGHSALLAQWRTESAICVEDFSAGLPQNVRHEERLRSDRTGDRRKAHLVADPAMNRVRDPLMESR